MNHFAEALAVVNGRLPEIFGRQAVAECCRRVGHAWRNAGPLPPWALVSFFLMQVLKANTACTHVRFFGGKTFSGTAYCKARKRLPLAVFEALLEQVASLAGQAQTWHGLRVFFVDGTGCSMPDTPELAKHFGYPGSQKPGCGFPVAHLLHLMDAATGMILKTLISPGATGDLTHFSKLLPLLGEGALLIADRGFGVYAAFALCEEHKTQAILRVSRKSLKLKDHGTIGPGDRIVLCQPGGGRKAKSRLIRDPARWALLKCGVVLREISCRIRKSDGTETELVLLTTLLDARQYPASEIVALYLRRWEIEVNFRHLKRTLALDVLKGKSVDVVSKEIVAHAIAYNLVRQVMCAGAQARGVCAARVSFADALRWLLDCRAPEMLARLVLNPVRRRSAPRVVKRRRKGFPWMTKPRHAYPCCFSAEIVGLAA